MKILRSISLVVCSVLPLALPLNAQSFHDNFAPPYTNNWFATGNGGTPPPSGGCSGDICFTYTVDGLQWSTDASLTATHLNTNTVFNGDIDVSFTYNHQNFGRTNVGLITTDAANAIAIAALDTDDTNYLNFIVPNCSDSFCSTEYQHSGTPYMNRWATIRIKVEGTSVMFFAGVDGNTPVLLNTLHLSSPLASYRLYLDVHSAPWKSGGNTTTFRSVIANPSNSVLGLDVSKYQCSVDWQQVLSAQKSFAFVRATQGTTHVDPDFSCNLSNADITGSSGIIMGAYHFATALLDINRPATEANFFLKVAQSYTSSGYLPPALDVEDDPNIQLVSANDRCLTRDINGNPVGVDLVCELDGNVVPARNLSAWVRTWIQTVEGQIHRKPVLYMTRRYARAMESDLSAYPLWIANYPSQPDADPGDIGPWSNTNPAPNWTFQQYSKTGNLSGVECTPVDLDSFHGDINALGNLAGVTASSTVDAPTISPNGGTFGPGSVKIQLSCATPNASIYYTTDGTCPTTASNLYKVNGPGITLNATTTISAIGLAPGFTTSEITTAVFTKGKKK